MATNDFMGKDGFIWWIGVVENRFDPLYLGRVQVRVLGWHTQNKAEQPTSSLPWAYPLQPITSAAQTQVGITPLGLVEGSWVIGFFRDGQEAQEPVVMGSIGGIPEVESNPYVGFNDPRGYNPDLNPYAIDNAGRVVASTAERQNVPRDPLSIDVSTDGTGSSITEREDISNYPDSRFINEPTTNRLARGRADATSLTETSPDFRFVGDTIVEQKVGNRQKGQVGIRRAKGGPQGDKPTFDEPRTPYDAIYPYNHVQQSESGHIIEIDDSPGKERLHWYHRAGTFREIYPNGTLVDKSVQDYYNIVLRNYFQHIENTKVSTIDKGYELFVNADGEAGQDYYLRVGGPGRIYGEAEGGSIEFHALNNNFVAEGRNVVISATDSLTLNAQNITKNLGSINDNITGNMSEIVDGSRTMVAGSMSLSTFGEMSINPQQITQTVARSSSEFIQMFVNPVPFPIAASPAKLIDVGAGSIEIKSRNFMYPLGTGGILLKVEPASVPITTPNLPFLDDGSKVELENDGNINIKTSYAVPGPNLPIYDGTITVETNTTAPGKGDIEIRTSNPLARGGSINLRTVGPIGLADIGLNTFLGNISLISEGIGKITAKTNGAVEIDGLRVTINGKIGVLIDGLKIRVGQNATEPAILGRKFLEAFLKHTHGTGTGPSSVLLNPGPYPMCMSRKVFLE